MIIVITNRKLASIPVSQPVLTDLASLGDDLGERQNNEDIIYSGLLFDDNKVNFFPKGSEAELFSGISPTELNKPWVFFVHGFNQDPQSNIDKARALSANHGVNVIAFAWPSRPVDETMGWDDAGKSIVKGVLKGLSGTAIIYDLLLLKATRFLKDKWKNYPPAIRNAEESNTDLIAALNLIKDQLHLTRPLVLLVHSMGNYLLQKTLQGVDKLPNKFGNIILHQADATSPGFDWVKKLNANLHLNSQNQPAKLYITINSPDFVLGASTLRRAILRKDKVERIGQVRKNHVKGDIHYLDFSDGEWVDNEHEFFHLAKDNTNDYVYDCLDRIIKSMSDELPVNKNESKSGFSRMPADVSLYRLEYIIHPADEDEPIDDILPVKSLDLFNQQ